MSELIQSLSTNSATKQDSTVNSSEAYSRSRYLMDDPREAKRLDAKVNPDEFISTFLSPVLTEGAQTIADLGCGAGAIISALAAKFPEKQFFGVDVSAARLEQAQLKCFTEEGNALTNISFREGSIYEIPLASDSVDVVYTRFLLEYLKEPVAAIRELKRIIRPGGKVVLQDLDGQLLFQYPFSVPEMEQVFDYLNKKTGFDPYIGRKLFAYSRQAELVLDKMDVRAYHLFPGKIDDYNRWLWEMKFDIFMPQAAEALGSEEAAQQLKTKYMAFLDDPDTLLYSSLFTLYLTK
ncbi:methyltransferase domain-containing protein [Cytophagaceae bacterium YF14B1]|uniref:Methyltransferase domain-containing protein n=1 Tax=Xanthocytophaga flava TaxID=3048013 RepID=A0AAE3QH75_9BACT|nr:methyltransferase domain-containing protein [Xanthocytophaga flavus]MDJ1479317.1 methyltransferase domain-containing protein [Xanthocytophaga flavus]